MAARGCSPFWTTCGPIWIDGAREFVEHAADRPEPISIARGRELLGEEAASMTDQEIALIRRHAEAMACIVVEMYQEGRRISE
jgi:hypothetical protein